MVPFSQRGIDVAGADLLRDDAEAGQDLAGEAADAELQALQVIDGVDLLAEPTTHLAPGAAELEALDAVGLVEILHQFLPAAELQPGAVLALVHAERQPGFVDEGGVLAEIVVGGRLPRLHRAVLHGIQHLQCRHDLAGGEGADLEAVVRHLADHLGEQLGAAIQRVQRLGEAGRHAPLHFRHRLGDGRRGQRGGGRGRGADAGAPDEFATIHFCQSPCSSFPNRRAHGRRTLLCTSVSEWGQNRSVSRTHGGKPYHPSTQARFLPCRTGRGGTERSPATIQRRVSAGSITSSTWKWLPVLSALPMSYSSATKRS